MNLIMAITNVMFNQRPSNFLLSLPPFKKNIGALREHLLYNPKVTSFHPVSLISSLPIYQLFMRIILPISTIPIVFQDIISNKGGPPYEKLK